MLIINYMGGLGNQMFQYALYQNLKRNRNIQCHIVNDTAERPFKLDIFPNVKIDYVDDAIYYKIMQKHSERNAITRIFQKVTNSRLCYFENENKRIDSHIFTMKNGIISGYFQNELYFRPIKSQLPFHFSFPKGEKKLEDFINSLNDNCISVHIRRGDYLELDKWYGGICTEEYYSKAFKIIEGKLENPRYIVLSDDKSWAENFFADKHAMIVSNKMFDTYSDWYDMYIMSKCAHNITANSSFSWWGAWLNQNEEKIVIAPKKYNNIYTNSNIACDTWIKI